MDARWISRGLAVGLLVLAVPTGAAGPVGAMAPDRPPVGPPSMQSAPQVGHQSLPALGRVGTARIQTVARTRRPDRIAADLDKAHARLAAADDEFSLAAAELAARDDAATVAGRVVKDARAVRDEAQETATAAEQAMTGASDRLAELMAASDGAAAARAHAAARVEGERVGSKAHRAALTAWQMAAIADRAAHARQVVAEAQGAVAFEQLGAVAVALAEAEISLTAARSGRAKAEQSAAGALHPGGFPGGAASSPGSRGGCPDCRGGGGRRFPGRRRGSPERGRAVMRRLHPAAHVVPGLLLLTLATGPAAEARSDQESWRESGTVVRVLDGDTFDMDVDGTKVRVRINGIQAPETTWCGGAQARDALKEILPPGAEVRLASVKKASGNAPYGVWRLKRTVHTRVDGTWVDIAPELLSRGIVFPFPFVGEDAHNDEYLELANQAKEQGLELYDPEHVRSQRLARPASPARRGRRGTRSGHGRVGVRDALQRIGSRHRPDGLDGPGLVPAQRLLLPGGLGPAGRRLRRGPLELGQRAGSPPMAPQDDRFFYAGTGMRWNNETTDIAFLFDDAGEDRTGNLRDWLILTPGSEGEPREVIQSVRPETVAGRDHRPSASDSARGWSCP